ncbi:MATE family efflux transporter [Nonomuraea sp. NEAU-A123]|uniref:MATE family efflux transporter n=1 Tax=Nonomuraea sp. NEAU-A123 TaxID=2839649 RepID=UPI001BE400B4|nr:MATE family efflux transporter [Nonomuraea sp. NEAU-A123]MBT2228008.1 polysaccharide biosynthesis C-terminal domain-containing protein [Nonomuraea sp. NEAU-A123]
MIRRALPVYVELLTAVVAVGVIDLLWVSGLGEPAIAAVTVSTTVEYLAYGLFLAVPTGVTVLIGRRDGRAPLSPVIRTGWLLWAVFAIAIAVPGVLLREPLAALFAGDYELTAGFLLVSLGGLPVYFAQTIADGIVKGLGNTRIPMRNALVCGALVVTLDPLFIYGLDLGVQGAALATVIARTITLAISLRTLVRLTPRDSGDGPLGGEGGDPLAAEDGPLAGKSSAPLAAEGGGLLAGEVVRTGLPMSGDFLARALVGMALVGIVAGFGTAELAGYGVGQKVMLAGVMLFYALRQAAMIGAARFEATGSPLWMGLGAGAAVAVVLNVVAVPVAGLFAADVGPAVSFLRWMSLYLVPFGGLIAVGGVLQATGRGSRLLAATLAGFTVQLPLAYALSAWLGVTGVWLSMAAGAAISLGIAIGAGATADPGAPAVASEAPAVASDARAVGPKASVVASEGRAVSPGVGSVRRGFAPRYARGPAPRSTRTAADPPSGP